MTKRTTQSKTVAGRLFDVARVQDYEAAIARLRAANKKLRAELERVRDKCHENWMMVERISSERHGQYLIAQSWQQAHRQLAEAIGGKAK